MNSNYKIIRIILTLLLIFNFISCSKENNFEENKIFRYNEHSNISSLDPAFSSTLRNIWPVNQLFNGLVQLDKNLKIIPDLAKSWEVSDDGLTYIFKLKKAIYFHESESFGKKLTRPVIAKDFEYSFNRLKDPKLGSPSLWALKNIKSLQAKNDSIFTIELKQPFSAFLGILSMKYFSVVPE